MFKIICYEKSTVQNHTHKLAYPHPLGWLLFFKKEKTPSDTKDREKIVTLMHSWWECKTAWMQYKIVWCPPPNQIQNYCMTQQLGILKRIKSKILKSYLHTLFTAASLTTEATPVSANRWMNKQKHAKYIQWNMISPQKGSKFWHMPQHGWAQRIPHLANQAPYKKIKKCMIPSIGKA